MGRLIQNRKKTPLLDEEKPDQTDSQSLIALVRNWYACWLKDPDLLREDLDLLPQEWEQKIDFLKRKANRLFRRTNTLSIDETRLDDAVQKMANWLREQFKQSRVDWQDPKIWVNGIKLVGSAAMFPTAQGIVTEVGGWLSHAAIVAREYNVTTIVGVQGALDKIDTGDRLKLHLDGMIERL